MGAEKRVVASPRQMKSMNVSNRYIRAGKLGLSIVLLARFNG